MPPTTSSPAVERLAAENDVFGAMMQANNEVLDCIVSRLNLQPANLPSFDQPSAGLQGQGPLAATVGAETAAWRGRDSTPVRWLSSSALGNTSMDFGTTRLMAWADQSTDQPHYVLEFGQMGQGPGARSQATLTYAQRKDVMLDLEYIEKYYNTGASTSDGTGAEDDAMLPSFNEVYNSLMERQGTDGWQHYQVPFADMKPVIANSISYTFPATVENVAVFGAAALRLAMLWTENIAHNKGNGLSDEEAALVSAYDRRHVQVVHKDPGNAIAVKIFGEEATAQLIADAVGPV